MIFRDATVYFQKCSIFIKKKIETHKETEMYGRYTGKDTVNRNCPWGSSYIELRTEFKSAIVNILKELKEAMSIESKASMRIMCHKLDNNHEWIAIAKKETTRNPGEELAKRVQSKF